MKTSRLEAFSDGVLAIIITIMVLELKAPEGITFKALTHITPTFLSYIISFIYIGIYWNNHHHLFQITKKVSGKILWANLHLLFWLSLIPFATSWIGENHVAHIPVAFYGVVLFMSGIAFNLLFTTITKHHKNDLEFKKTFKNNKKANISLIIYFIGIVLSFFYPWLAIACYIIVAIFWFIPDRRIENSLS